MKTPTLTEASEEQDGRTPAVVPETPSLPRIIKIDLTVVGTLGVMDAAGNVLQKLPLQHVPRGEPVQIKTLDLDGFLGALRQVEAIRDYYQNEINASLTRKEQTP